MFSYQDFIWNNNAGDAGTSNNPMLHTLHLKTSLLGMEVAFATENAEQAYKTAIDAGAKEVTRPALKLWGQSVGYVRDVNGFLIEICTPIGYAHADFNT